MSLISLAEKTFDIYSCQNLFENLYKKGYIKKESLQDIYKDSDFKHLNKIKEDQRKALPYDSTKCDAREWCVENKNNTDYVLDNVQCKKIKGNGSCFCKFHQKKHDSMPNGWWLGKINESRPEPLIHPGHINPETGRYENPIEHLWIYENSVTEKKDSNIIEEKEKQEQKNNDEKPKKRRGRPPGSKNKKKKEPNKQTKKPTKKQPIIKEEKEDSEGKEEEKPNTSFTLHYEDDEEDSKLYEVDGFAYSINSEGDVINPHTYDYMGTSDGNGGIDFIDEDAKEKHQINVETI